MNGKLQKIRLGLLSLMCVGMLFSCVLTSEAGCQCSTPDWQFIAEYDSIISYDHSVHAFVNVVKKKCGICEEGLTIITVLDTENHDIVEFWDTEENCWAEECGICGYTYYYHY